MSSANDSLPQSLDPALLMHQVSRLIALQERASQMGNPQSKSVPGHLRHKGRLIRRLVSLYDSAHDMFKLAEADRRTHVVNMNATITDHTDAENCLYKSYKELLRWIPSIRDIPQTELVDALQQLERGADTGRTDDTHRLKVLVASWLMQETPKPYPPLTAEDKSGRGFYNDATGRLLCPVDYDWNNPVHRQKIREFHPNFLVTAQSWPAFLYYGGRSDPSNLDDGLFRGDILVKAFRAIFISPTSADGFNNESSEPSAKRRRGDRRTRTNVAKLSGMQTVQPRAIAYVACQLRFALSSAGSWAIADDVFDARELYEAIIEWFEETKTEEDKMFVDELLLWWNKMVFGPTFSFQIERDDSVQKSVAKSLKKRRIIVGSQ